MSKRCRSNITDNCEDHGNNFEGKSLKPPSRGPSALGGGINQSKGIAAPTVHQHNDTHRHRFNNHKAASVHNYHRVCNEGKAITSSESKTENNEQLRLEESASKNCIKVYRRRKTGDEAELALEIPWLKNNESHVQRLRKERKEKQAKKSAGAKSNLQAPKQGKQHSETIVSPAQTLSLLQEPPPVAEDEGKAANQRVDHRADAAGEEILSPSLPSVDYGRELIGNVSALSVQRHEHEQQTTLSVELDRNETPQLSVSAEPQVAIAAKVASNDDVHARYEGLCADAHGRYEALPAEYVDVLAQPTAPAENVAQIESSESIEWTSVATSDGVDGQVSSSGKSWRRPVLLSLCIAVAVISVGIIVALILRNGGETPQGVETDDGSTMPPVGSAAKNQTVSPTLSPTIMQTAPSTSLATPTINPSHTPTISPSQTPTASATSSEIPTTISTSTSESPTVTLSEMPTAVPVPSTVPPTKETSGNPSAASPTIDPTGYPRLFPTNSPTRSVAAPQEPCKICGPGNALPYPDRVVFLEGQAPTTCAQLEQAASESTALCDNASIYEFYCGCPGVDPSCFLCASGELSPFPDLVLKGFAPESFPNTMSFTCAEFERQRSLIGENQTECTATENDVQDIALLCGCFIPSDTPNCTTICPDGSLIDPAVSNVPLWGSITCSDYQIAIASGLFWEQDCNDAHYVGIKRCGCSVTRSFCDICEDGTGVEDLAKNITFQQTCLNYAGDAYSNDPQADRCKAYQSTVGIYCGCENPIASIGACRICDEAGGEVVSDPNLTIPVGQFVADCGELEFTGNDPSNINAFTCQDVIDFGFQCCENAPSAAPTG